MDDRLCRLLPLVSPIPMGMDEGVVAGGADGLVLVDAVAAIEKGNPRFFRHFEHRGQKLLAGLLPVAHPVAGEKPGQMPDLDSQVGKRASQVLDHRFGMDAFDQERGNFQMFSSSHHLLHIVQHHIQISFAYFLIKGGISLHIDIEGIDGGKDPIPAFPGKGAVGDHDGEKAASLCQGRDVRQVILPDSGLAVGKADAAGLGAPGNGEDLLWRIVFALHKAFRLTDHMVLAEQATVVATGFCQREAERTGKEMIQRLLLDRIEGQRDEPAIVRRTDLSPLIPAASAKTELAVGDGAMPPAKGTIHERRSPKTSAWKVS